MRETNILKFQILKTKKIMSQFAIIFSKHYFFVHHLTTENDFPLPKDMDIRKNALEKSKTARLGQSKKVQHQ